MISKFEFIFWMYLCWIVCLAGLLLQNNDVLHVRWHVYGGVSVGASPQPPVLLRQQRWEPIDQDLETFLDDLKRKVEVTATSYHSASQLTGSLFHGYILVYSVRRRASLSNLK